MRAIRRQRLCSLTVSWPMIRASRFLANQGRRLERAAIRSAVGCVAAELALWRIENVGPKPKAAARHGKR